MAFEHRAVPADPVGVGVVVRRTGCDQLDRAIGPAHRFRGFAGELGVVFGVLVTDLPGTVELVAESPILHRPRFVAAVLAAQIGERGVARFVGVLDPLARFVDGAEAGVDAQVRLGADLFAVAEELVGAEAVRFDVAPGVVGADGAAGFGTDAVAPVVAGDEVAAGVTEQRHAEVADGFHDVGAEAVGVR